MDERDRENGKEKGRSKKEGSDGRGSEGRGLDRDQEDEEVQVAI